MSIDRRVRIKLENKWLRKLINLPETGMGYQIIDVSLKNGKELNKILVMGSFIYLPEGINQNDFIEVKLSEKQDNTK